MTGTVDEQAPPRRRPATGLSTTADGARLPTARERARRRFDLEDRFTGWLAAVLVFLLSLFLRLWHLSRPRSFLFDETYYAKDAWSLLKFGHAQDYVTDADKMILNGQTSGFWKDTPSMNVHPEVGKWMIAAGERLFGLDPFGWRVASAVTGALMILVMVRFVRRVTGSTLWGVVAGLLLCFDGLHLVLSRLALLDIFLAFWILCAVHCLVADREWFRRRLADRVDLDASGRVRRGWGPVRAVLWRPWLLASGVCWGLAIGTKWTAIYPLAAFGLLCWAWSAGARRSFGVRRPVLRSAVTDGVVAFVHLVLVATVVYTATWTGWLMHAKTYEEHLSSTQYTTYTGTGHCNGETWVPSHPSRERWSTATERDAQGLGEVVQSLHSLWLYHQDVYTFHTDFLNCATHPYESMPSGWLLLNRPVAADAQNDIKPGDQGCRATGDQVCRRIITLLGNPIVWWGSCLALLFSVVMWVGARDWRFGVAVVGTASTWLPWTLYDERPIFIFYAIATLPFMVLAIALTLARIVGADRGPSARRTLGVVVAGSFMVLTVLTFAWFWPVWTDALLTNREWMERMWFQKWI